MYLAPFLIYREIFNLPNLYLAPLVGVTPFKFHADVWQQKTRASEVMCGVVCLILRFALWYNTGL